LELMLRIDKKGRVLIPAHVRKSLGFKRVVRARVEEGRLILEPVRDPLEKLTAAVIKGTRDVEQQVTELRRAAEKEALRRVSERWSL